MSQIEQQIKLKDWADYKFIFQLKKDLKTLKPGEKVELECFTRGEAEWIDSMLNEDEKAKIARYTWLNIEVSER